MAKHRSHAATRRDARSYSSAQHDRPRRQNENQPHGHNENRNNHGSGRSMQANQAQRSRADAYTMEGYPIVMWPLQMFEAMMQPWHQLMPAWDRMKMAMPMMPKAETQETASEYIYKVRLPDVPPEQVDLSFRND